MTLVVERPSPMPVDRSQKQTIQFASPADGCRVSVDLYSPPGPPPGPLPLLLAPHPITWTAAQDYHGGLEGLMRQYHPGYYGLAEKHGVVIAMPHGHHHREALCSLAGAEQIDDMAYLIDAVEQFGYRVDRSRVYACGLSMGGQEALVFAGRHPDKVTAIVAFNPIVDLAAWHEELATSEIAQIREYDTARRIANEVGGTPGQVPEAYRQRSAFGYLDNLAQVPCLIFWSEHDLIVPRQVTHHTLPLYRQLKEINPNAPCAEYNHTKMHGPLQLDLVTRWQLHEWCDYDLALAWLLRHVK